MTENQSSSRNDRVNEAIAGYLQAVERGEQPDRETFLAQHGDIADDLGSFLDNNADMTQQPAYDSFEPTVRYHRHGEAKDAGDGAINFDVPARIGRYRIEKRLGKGGFDLVYLAHDEQSNRRVAVKVTHSKLISKPEYAEAYLA
jgi:hypothetical protein